MSRFGNILVFLQDDNPPELCSNSPTLDSTWDMQMPLASFSFPSPWGPLRMLGILALQGQHPVMNIQNISSSTARSSRLIFMETRFSATWVGLQNFQAWNGVWSSLSNISLWVSILNLSKDEGRSQNIAHRGELGIARTQTENRLTIFSEAPQTRPEWQSR